MAFGLTTYVSRCWLPFTAQGSLPAAGQALPDGLLPAGFLQKVFNSLHVRWPPFPSFLAQSPFQLATPALHNFVINEPFEVQETIRTQLWACCKPSQSWKR